MKNLLFLNIRTKVKIFVSLLLLSVCPFRADSAPIPGTSSSSFLAVEKGLYWSKHGFSIHSGQTLWKPSILTTDNRFIEVLYVSPESQNGVQPSLTVRVDKVEKNISVLQYVNRWKNDYPRFGFDILLAKKINVREEEVYLLDMVSPQTNRQLRQYIFLKDRKAVTMTCRAHTKSFQSVIFSCNQIVKNFSWSNSI